ncbi:hypothetical protein AB0M54_24250 [Actinoplanes sp. NPDC051470]|uniref:hypothetical protein n=1 Tax=Actinoplanes sp. NPDC051470 TaxID=3157224 RepID=UPI0034192D91
MKKFQLSRDPAFYVGLAAAAIQFFSLFVTELSGGQQAALNAVVVALAGFATALWVRRDGQIAALVGVAQAVVSGVLYFGIDLSAERQASIMALITLVAAAFVRTQVEAPAPPPEVVR